MSKLYQATKEELKQDVYKVIDVLSKYVKDGESAIETLDRLLRESNHEEVNN